MVKFTPIWALGLMSGTSLDGVDGAMVLTDGQQILDFGASFFRPYSEHEHAILRDALGLWPDGDETRLQLAKSIVEQAHSDVIAHFPTADVVGFHGQTLAHDPAAGRTFQIGDGAALAAQTGKKIVWDFRTADMAAGGEGAPLAPFFHFALAKQLGGNAPIAFLNLGGVGNVSWIDPSKMLPTDTGALLAFDTGPANAPINDLMVARTNATFDEDGAHALAGRVDVAVLEDFFKHEYFERIPPKSLDRNDFKQIDNLVSDLSLDDGVATLTALAASSAYAAQMHFPSDPARWLICGGGRRNPALMQGLQQRLDQVAPCEDVGFDGDMLEAQAFAYLAVRVMRGLATSAPSTTGCSEPVCGGMICAP
ncbi:UNVERIFIED_CONTAM: hypothetical protein GTU68_024355 [Idotea baltica]|nr:hypothetical protein [Idotea baltica]